MLDRLIQIQILLQRATPADKAEGKEKMDTQIAALIQRSGSKEAFERQLKTVGITADDLRAKVIQEATAMAALKRELKVTVTDADVKKFYEENPAEFEQPETAHVRHILLLTMDPTTRQPLALDQQQAKRKKIDDILKQIRSGGDFAALATQYSEDPGSKDNGGELPDFPRGQMLPEFEAAAFSLATNQVSDMVTTMYGYHIIKLLGKTPAKKVALTDKAPLTEQTIADKVKEALSQQQVEKLAPAYLDGLKKSSGVEILDPALKALESSSTNAPLVAPVR
ncbi:MAG: peptidylprolyl isomerase [Limisphaerales bacterium]